MRRAAAAIPTITSNASPNSTPEELDDPSPPPSEAMRALVGAGDTNATGTLVSLAIGVVLGVSVGDGVGAPLGASVGTAEGDTLVGAVVGDKLGAKTGASVRPLTHVSK